MSSDAVKKRLVDPEERKLVLEAWKAIVGVQMHFNDMLMRVRNLGVTLILAVFGAAAFSLQYELYFKTPWGAVHLAALIVIFGLVAWTAIWFMDRYYNKLLAGAVRRSTSIEDIYEDSWLGMTHDITAESRSLLGITNAMRARTQMALFLYLPVGVVGILYILAVALWFQPSYRRPLTEATSPLHDKATSAPPVGKTPSVNQVETIVPRTVLPPTPAPGRTSDGAAEKSRPTK